MWITGEYLRILHRRRRWRCCRAGGYHRATAVSVATAPNGPHAAPNRRRRRRCDSNGGGSHPAPPLDGVCSIYSAM